jgi:hypothetical protein
VLSLVSLGVIGLLSTVFLGAFFYKARKKVDSKLYASPRKTLYALWSVNERFKRRDYDKDGKPNYATSLQELQAAQCVQDDLVDGVVIGYRYAMEPLGPTGYVVTATPAEVTSQALFYRMTHDGRILAEFGQPATEGSDLYWDRRYKFQWQHAWPPGEDGQN